MVLKTFLAFLYLFDAISISFVNLIVGHTCGTHTHKSLFPASGDEVLCFQICSKREISYHIVVTLIVYVFTSKKWRLCICQSDILFSIFSLWPKVVPPTLKKTTCKTTISSTTFRFCNEKLKQFLSTVWWNILHFFKCVLMIKINIEKLYGIIQYN